MVPYGKDGEESMPQEQLLESVSDKLRAAVREVREEYPEVLGLFCSEAKEENGEVFTDIYECDIHGKAKGPVLKRVVLGKSQ